MANYDAVAGVDQSTLNRMSDQLYEIIYPLVFKGDVIVDREVLYSALYDIRKPPVFRLRFDTAAFYEDLCEVCVNARSKEWGGS